MKTEPPTLMKLLSKIPALLLSPTTKSAVFYAVMGVGFSGAHLVLAKVLPILEYAAIALALAIINLATVIAPLGAEGVINRQRLRPDRRMLLRAAWTCTAVGLSIVIGSGMIYGLDVSILSLLLAGIVGGGVTHVAAAVYQSRQTFGPALFLSQSSNVFLLSAACAVAAFGFRKGWVALAMVVGGYWLAALWSWSRLLAAERGSRAATADYSWREALSFVVVSGASTVLLQAERLLIPSVLSLEDLATFGVVAAIVIAPYRTLQMGATFTMLPRLRAAETVTGRRRLLVKELFVLTAALAAGSILLGSLASFVLELIYQGKYDIPQGLIWAAIAAGIVKSYSGLAKAAAIALCTTRELAALGVLVWLSVGVGVVGAAIGASWGLSGLVLGIAAGWVTLILVYSGLASRHLRE